MCVFRIVTILICIFVSTCVYCQDLIVTKTGENIECRILSIDTIKVVYRLKHQSPRHEINRTEIENYYLSKVTANELAYLNRPEIEFFSLKFSGGLAYPLGDFASMDATSELSGLAYRGNTFCGDLIFNLSKYVGLQATYLSQRHALNYQTISNYYNSYYKVTNFTASGEDWLISGGFIGLNFSLPVKQYSGLSVHGDISFGAPKFTYPQQVVKGSANPQISAPVTATFSRTETHSGAFKSGIGLRYKLNKNLALHLSASYFSAKPAFFDILLSATNGYTEYINYVQKIQTINLQGGISFVFYKK